MIVQGLAPAVQSSINQLPGEIRGLFLDDLQVTGFSADDLLIQSLFFHYPSLFDQLELNLPYFLFLDPNDQQYLNFLQEFYHLDILEVISRLLRISPDPELPSSKFPSRSSLQLPLDYSVYFHDFPPERRYSILLQKLIMQYHLMIQPRSISGSLFSHEPSPYQLVYFNLSSDDAKTLLDQVSHSVYAVKRPDYHIRTLLHKRWQYIHEALEHVE